MTPEEQRSAEEFGRLAARSFFQEVSSNVWLLERRVASLETDKSAAIWMSRALRYGTAIVLLGVFSQIGMTAFRAYQLTQPRITERCNAYCRLEHATCADSAEEGRISVCRASDGRLFLSPHHE